MGRQIHQHTWGIAFSKIGNDYPTNITKEIYQTCLTLFNTFKFSFNIVDHFDDFIDI